MSNYPSYLDEIDLEILNYLQNDGKLTAKNLADKIDLTQTPVYERIKKLEKLGIIKQYVALLDPALLNKNLIVFLNVSVREHDLSSRNKLVKALSKLQEIVELYHTSGLADFTAKVRVADIKEYRRLLVDKISVIDNIKDLTSNIVLEEIKYTTNIPL